MVNAGSAAVLAVLGWLVEGRLSVPVLLGIVFALGWAWCRRCEVPNRTCPMHGRWPTRRPRI